MGQLPIASSLLPGTFPVFDARSEGNLVTLLPLAQIKMRQFLAALHGEGIDAKVLSGNRSYEEQNALYAQGRSRSGSIVTNARGGESNHNFGVAVDIGIFEGATYLDESPLYAKAGAVGKSLGLEWGGDWKSIQDEPHFQLPTGKTLAELRACVAGGVPYLPAPEVWTVHVRNASGEHILRIPALAGITLVPARDLAALAPGGDATGVTYDSTLYAVGYKGQTLGAAILLPRQGDPSRVVAGHVPLRPLAAALGLSLAINGANKTLVLNASS